ncbi:MAG: cytochrome c oxidase assembly factor Coa1 family protein [Arenimonas sp.]
MNQTYNPSWWGRNWKWFVPTICFIAFLAFCSFIGLIFYGVASAMKSSDAYKIALDQARNSPEVTAAIGTPISEGFFTSGSVNVNGASGMADLAIPISGPKGKATIYLSATKSLGKWTFKDLVVEIEKDHARIDLLQEQQSP